MSNHPPGLWTYDPVTPAAAPELLDACLGIISAYEGERGISDSDIGTVRAAIANARLIAAAPELLEALNECSQVLGSLSLRGDIDPSVIRARAAIAKAKGESPC